MTRVAQVEPAPVEGTAAASRATAKRPLYARLLRLRHLELTGWHRALLGDGSVALAVLLVLADLATAWTVLVLPVAVAVVVKAHDLLAGVLSGTGRTTAPPPEGAAPTDARGS